MVLDSVWRIRFRVMPRLVPQAAFLAFFRLAERVAALCANRSLPPAGRPDRRVLPGRRTAEDPPPEALALGCGAGGGGTGVPDVAICRTR